MSAPSKNGKILTFYSFKGGVGRTMALANMAYFAAISGQRVLVMDWDLEAPGLDYYFRGLLDSATARSLKERPGILNLVFEWSSALRNALTNNDICLLNNKLDSGSFFNETVQRIVEKEFLPENVTIDYIGAGSKIVNIPEEASYEDALARFSWSTFFEEYGGGLWVDALRKWAKHNYDLILIDSRTGLADVAGLCTMQLPDEVALCFVLNRQNIEGTARVAAAIRTKRSEEVKLRAIPMRVARMNTPEEIDARAKAIAELSRVGMFAQSVVEKDISLLAVPAAENLPFYETLAPFAVDDITKDVLSLHYRTMASALLGMEINVPVISEDVVAKVRQRSQPRYATVDYVVKLQSAEPNRAILELSRLIEGALEAINDGNSSDDNYILALVDTAFSINDQEYISECLELQALVLDLLRTLSSRNSSVWRMRLASAIERHLVLLRQSWFDDEDELALLEELDSLLADLPTNSARLQRIFHRRRVAWLYLNRDEFDAANQVGGEVSSLSKDLMRDQPDLSVEQKEEIAIAEIDIGLLRGNIFKRKQSLAQAKEAYMGALERARFYEANITRPDYRKIRTDLHSELALLDGISPDEISINAIDAAKWGAGTVGLASRFLMLTRAILAAGYRVYLIDFLAEIFNNSSSRNLIANVYARHVRTATSLLQVIREAVDFLVTVDDELLNHLVQAVELVLKSVSRRKNVYNERERENLINVAIETLERFGSMGCSEEALLTSLDSINFLKSRRIRGSRAAQDGDAGDS